MTHLKINQNSQYHHYSIVKLNAPTSRQQRFLKVVKTHGIKLITGDLTLKYRKDDECEMKQFCQI